jgi:hypothetical protein
MSNLGFALGTERRCTIFRLYQSYSLCLMNLDLNDDKSKGLI